MPLQVEVLEQSFESIKPSADEFVNSFYQNLFTANPEAKPLFEHTNMASQKKMLLNSLVMVVENLRNPNVLNKSLRGLGARHVKYGALPVHYPMVGGALLTAFEQHLGDKWTPEVKEAWIDAYGAISELMLDGAEYSEADIALTTEAEAEEAGLQVELLETSFEEIKPQANEFVDSFYQNLFTANPEAKPLFEHTNMASQKKMLLNSLVMVVENLRNPDVLDKSLRGLGARHVKYGALPVHYPMVGGALLTSFEQHLGDKWTPKVKEAWVGAYGAISELMLDGADYSQEEVTLKSEPSNTEIAPPSTQPLTNADSTSSEISSSNASVAVGSSEVMNSEATSDFVHDSGKATIAAFAGGGILGIIATILVMLV